MSLSTGGEITVASDQISGIGRSFGKLYIDRRARSRDGSLGLGKKAWRARGAIRVVARTRTTTSE
jgi:hypothetical protein